MADVINIKVGFKNIIQRLNEQTFWPFRLKTDVFVLRASTEGLRLQEFVSGNIEPEQNMNFVQLLAFPRKSFSENV